jgi:hypothetical protein
VEDRADRFAPGSADLANHTALNGKNGAHVENSLAAASVAVEHKSDAPLTPTIEAAKKISWPVTSNGAATWLPPEFIKMVEQKLLWAMGPMAPLIVREQLGALEKSVTSSPKLNAERLAKEVGKEISNAYHRQRFEKEVAEEIHKLDSLLNGQPAEKSVLEDRQTSEARAVPDSQDTRGLLRIIISKLGDAMGPIAPLLVREHIVALGRSPESFPESDLEHLVTQVAGEIPGVSARRQFEKDMAKELRIFKEQGAGARSKGPKTARG